MFLEANTTESLENQAAVCWVRVVCERVCEWWSGAVPSTLAGAVEDGPIRPSACGLGRAPLQHSPATTTVDHSGPQALFHDRTLPRQAAWQKPANNRRLFPPSLARFLKHRFPGAVLSRIVSFSCQVVVVAPLFNPAGGSVFQRWCFPSPLMNCPPQNRNPNPKSKVEARSQRLLDSCSMG